MSQGYTLWTFSPTNGRSLSSPAVAQTRFIGDL